jgi:hypothetical protein
MPVNWGILQSQVITHFDNNQAKKSESDTARMLGNAYYNSILSANISLIPGSLPIPSAPTLIINGFETTLRIIKNKTAQPTPADFTAAASGIIQFWLATQWNPLPPPPGYVGPITGNQTLFPGAPAPLNYNLWNAFNNKTPGKVGAVIAAKLINALTIHLTTVQGLYIGLIPGPVGPIPGPPFPWLGIV